MQLILYVAAHPRTLDVLFWIIVNMSTIMSSNSWRVNSSNVCSQHNGIVGTGAGAGQGLFRLEQEMNLRNWHGPRWLWWWGAFDYALIWNLIYRWQRGFGEEETPCCFWWWPAYWEGPLHLRPNLSGRGRWWKVHLTWQPCSTTLLIYVHI